VSAPANTCSVVIPPLAALALWKPNSVDRCTFTATTLGFTRAPRGTATAPRGRWTYRVGVVANWLDDQHYGDVYFISTPAVARVG
jgi:hypothetical protein